MSAHLDTITVCESAFAILEATIPDPMRVPANGDFKFRYESHTPNVVVVQKLSRIVTGLYASIALMERGLYQELAVIFRLLDEFGEDVSFMCEAIRRGEQSNIQRRFIEEFFQEEFDTENPLLATQHRHRVSRRQIHAAIARVEENPLNPSDSQELYRTITNANSGYVHGASEHILEMYGGNPPGYYLSGMLGTRRQPTFEDTSWNYFYRGLLSFMEAATSFGLAELRGQLYAFRTHFEEQWGQTEWPCPE